MAMFRTDSSGSYCLREKILLCLDIVLTLKIAWSQYFFAASINKKINKIIALKVQSIKLFNGSLNSLM